MSGHRRRRQRRSELGSEKSSGPTVTDPDLVAAWPKYGSAGRDVLSALQRARDGIRRQMQG